MKKVTKCQCTHCSAMLGDVGYNQSALIPDTENWCYIICNGCHNVMKALLNSSGNLDTVSPTPNTSGPETMAMMKEAAELFKLSHTSFWATGEVSAHSIDGETKCEKPLDTDHVCDCVEPCVECKCKDTEEEPTTITIGGDSYTHVENDWVPTITMEEPAIPIEPTNGPFVGAYIENDRKPTVTAEKPYHSYPDYGINDLESDSFPRITMEPESFVTRVAKFFKRLFKKV